MSLLAHDCVGVHAIRQGEMCCHLLNKRGKERQKKRKKLNKSGEDETMTRQESLSCNEL